MLRGTFLLLFFLFFLTIKVKSQNYLDLYISAVDYVTRDKINEITLEIYRLDSLVQTVKQKSKKDIYVQLASGFEYKVVVQKEGKVPRYFKFSLENLSTDNVKKHKPKSIIEISLFDRLKDVDYKFVLDNPVAEYYYDVTHSLMVFDFERAQKMSNKVFEIVKHAEESTKKKGELYKKAISIADEAFEKQNFQHALDYYIKASHLKSYEEYPLQQVEKIKHALEEIKKKEEERLKILAEQKELAKVPIKEEYKFKLIDKKKNKEDEQYIFELTELPKGLFFSVQVGAYRYLDVAKKYKDLTPVFVYKTNGELRNYSTGYFRTLQEANIVLGKLKVQGYTDAFVIAYFNNHNITLKEAREIQKIK